MSLFRQWSSDQLYDRRRDESPFGEREKYLGHVLISRVTNRVQRCFGCGGCFIRIVYTGKAANAAASGLSVHALGVARFTHFKWRVDENLDKTAGPDKLPHLVTCRAVWAYSSTNRDTAVTNYFRGYVTYSQNI